MSRPSSKAFVTDRTEERCSVARAARRRLSGWRRVAHPSVLGVFGLALAIFLWGYSYRLSLYQPQRDIASRTLAAKLWVDQKHAAATPQLNQNTERYASADAPALFPVHLFEPVYVGAIVAQPTLVHRPYVLQSLLPLRSPPIPSFLG
jgi:hypothetical protein